MLRKVPADQRDSILLELQAMLQSDEVAPEPKQSRGRAKTAR